jgi:hypothetical protein
MVRINLIIFGLFLTFNLFGQYPRIILKQLEKADSSGQFIIADSDSNAVWSDALYITTDSLLTLYGDTIEGGVNYEKIQDTIAAMLEAGLGIQMTYNDEDGEFLIESLSIEDSIYNGSGSLINKGTPLYAVGTQGNYWNVAPADASDITKLPAVVIAGEDIGIGETGVGLLKGHIKQVNTTGLADGDEVYVGVGGGYTNVKPKGESNYVQRLGTVIKGNSANGSGIINLGEVQSVSNLNAGNIFIGDTDSTITTTVYIVDSSRVNATGDSLIYYQNGVQVGADAIGGALSGLVEDQVIFGAADGSLEQDSNLIWDGLRLNIGQYLNNVFIGYNSGNSNVSGTDNTALGTQALGSIASGLYNTAIGDGALSADSSGNQNVAIGRSSLILNKTGFRNTAIGNQSLNSNVNGFQNIAIGYISGGENVSGFDNIFIGSHSGRESTGDRNIFIEIGLTSASNTLTGDDNIVIGYSLQPSMYGDADKNILIGNDIALMDSVGDNQLNIANAIFGVGLTGTGTTIDSSASIGINNNNPTATLDVTGWVNVSDSLVVNDIRVTGSGGGTINGVTTDATLTGDGTSATPLSVVDDGHNHIISNVDNLQTTLDGKQAQLNGTGFVKATGTTISYDNSTYLTAEVDGSISNEGSLTVGAGGANDAVISSNTSGSSDVTISGGTNVTVTESGQTITISSTGGGAIPVDTFVTIAGTETITGAKTFTSTTTVDANLVMSEENASVIGQIDGTIQRLSVDGVVDELLYYRNRNSAVKDSISILSGWKGLAGSFTNMYAGKDTTLVIDATNNRVGIGTSSPLEELHLERNANTNTLMRIQNTDAGTSARTGISLWNGTGNGDNFSFLLNGKNYNGVSGWANKFTVQSGGTTDGMIFYASNGGIQFSKSGTNAPDLYVSDETGKLGNIGIGTSSPSVKLSVEGNATTGSRNLIEVQDPNYDGYFGIGSGSNSNFTARLEGGTSGVNGIGTGYIAAIPEANDAITAGAAVINFQAREYSDFVNRTGASAVETANVVAFNNYSTNLMLIEADGDVVIADLAGTGTRTVEATSNGTLQAPSTMMIKENIEQSIYGLSTINNLNPVTFYYKDKEMYGSVRDIGFLAEEVYQILPEASGQNADGSYYLDKSKITPVLTKAIQEQQSIIESQASEIEQLKSQIQLILSEIEQIKNN